MTEIQANFPISIVAIMTFILLAIIIVIKVVTTNSSKKRKDTFNKFLRNETYPIPDRKYLFPIKSTTVFKDIDESLWQAYYSKNMSYCDCDIAMVSETTLVNGKKALSFKLLYPDRTVVTVSEEKFLSMYNSDLFELLRNNLQLQSKYTPNYFVRLYFSRLHGLEFALIFSR